MGIRLNPIAERNSIDPDFGEPRKSNLAAQAAQPVSIEPIRQTKEWLLTMEKAKIKAKVDAESTLKTQAKNDITNEMKLSRDKVLQAQGENAFIAATKAQTELREKIDNVVAKVPEGLRDDVRIDADLNIRAFNETSQGHQMSEYKKLQADTYKTRQEALIEQAVLSSSNITDFNRILGQVDQNTLEYFKITKGGLDGEASEEVKLDTMANQLKARSNTILKTVESYVSMGDMTSANFFAKQYQPTVTGSDQIRINKLLKDGTEQEVDSQAKVLFDRILSNSNNDEMVAIKMAQDSTGSDGKLYNKVESMLKSYHSSYRTNDQIRRDKTVAEANTAIRNGGMPDMTKIDGRDRPAVYDYMQKAASDGFNVRNPRVYNEMYQKMLVNPEDFKDPEKTNIRAKAAYLSAADIQMFESQQRQMQDPSTSRYTMGNVNHVVNAYVDKLAAAKGYSMKDDPKEFTAIRAQIRSLGMEVLSDVLASLGDKASPSEVERKFNAEMAVRTQKIGPKKGFFSRVQDVFTGEPGAFGQLRNPDEGVIPDKDLLKDRSTQASDLVNSKDPETQQVVGILQDDLAARGEKRSPTNKEVLSALNALRKNRLIKKNIRRK